MVGGYRFNFDGVTATQCAVLVTNKILFNSTVYTPGDRFCIFDIKYFYYGRPMSDCEYISIQLTSIQKEIIYQYDLEAIQHDGWAYIEIQKGITGLKHTGKIGNDHLWTYLKQYRYGPFRHATALWKHETRYIAFKLLVDNFAINFTNRQDSEHLASEVEDLYVITKDLY